MFSRADALYEKTPDGLRIKPLAHMLAEALDAPSMPHGSADCSGWEMFPLFIAGFFARSFAKVDRHQFYHIAMGGNAYSSLADTMQRSTSGRSIAAIYAQLAQKISAPGGRPQRGQRNVLLPHGRGYPAAL